MRSEAVLFNICRACPENMYNMSKTCWSCDVFKELHEMSNRELKAIQENRKKRGIPMNRKIMDDEVTSHAWDRTKVMRMIDLGVSLKTIALRTTGPSYPTLAIFRREYLTSKGYSKADQLKMNTRKKTKKRNSINNKEYEKMIQEFGSDCFFCKGNGVEAHHVKYRSQGGRGTWRNLRMLCIACHDDLHNFENMRLELQAEHERLFGKNYYMDRDDLYDKGLIAEPSDELLEAYFFKRE